jgi:hypothetical protein
MKRKKVVITSDYVQIVSPDSQFDVSRDRFNEFFPGVVLPQEDFYCPNTPEDENPIYEALILDIDRALAQKSDVYYGMNLAEIKELRERHLRKDASEYVEMLYSPVEMTIILTGYAFQGKRPILEARINVAYARLLECLQELTQATTVEEVRQIDLNLGE